MKQLLNSRSGSAYWFIYILAFGFVLAILYIIFNQTLTVYIYPTTQFLSGGDTVAADKFLGYWAMIPFMIVLIVGMFMYFRLTQSSSGE